MAYVAQECDKKSIRAEVYSVRDGLISHYPVSVYAGVHQVEYNECGLSGEVEGHDLLLFVPETSAMKEAMNIAAPITIINTDPLVLVGIVDSYLSQPQKASTIPNSIPAATRYHLILDFDIYIIFCYLVIPF